MIVT
jgi:hypothetical protein